MSPSIGSSRIGDKPGVFLNSSPSGCPQSRSALYHLACLESEPSGYHRSVDLLDVLRRQAGHYECPNCGQSLADCRLDMVSASDLEAVVRITCRHCETSRLVAVQALAPATDVVPVRDQPVSSQPVITADDVLDVRLALAGHQGDLASLLTT